MKKLSFLAFLAIVMMGIAFASCDSKKTVSLKSDIDSVSYLLGAYNGQGFRESVKNNPNPPLNLEALSAGFTNAATGDSIHLGMAMQEMQTFLNTFFQEYQGRIAEENKAEADKFLAENKGKPGIFTTESGLQYQVITEGTGPKPKLEEWVRVHYTGQYIDGTIFNNSYEQGQPVDFPVNGVIEGFKEGLQLMPVGSKFKIWVPVELGYGTSRQEIRPNSLLIFELELLEIVPAPAQ